MQSTVCGSHPPLPAPGGLCVGLWELTVVKEKNPRHQAAAAEPVGTLAFPHWPVIVGRNQKQSLEGENPLVGGVFLALCLLVRNGRWVLF